MCHLQCYWFKSRWAWDKCHIQCSNLCPFDASDKHETQLRIIPSQDEVDDMSVQSKQVCPRLTRGQ